MEDVYYRIRLTSREMPNGRWMARASILRNDSGEEVSGVQTQGATVVEAEDKLKPQYEVLFNNLPRPPHEWGRLGLRELLTAYREYNDRLTSILARLNASRAAGCMTEDELHKSYWEAREKAIRGAVALASKINALTEQDQIDLMTSADYVYNDPGNARFLDDMDSREALFDFISNPSKKVIQAHQLHLKRYLG